MSADTLHIETPVEISDLVTFHSDVDSALMHVQTSSEMVLRPLGSTPLGEHTGLIFVICSVVAVLIGLCRFMSSSYLTKLFSFIVTSSRGRGSIFSDLFLHYIGASSVISVVFFLVDSLILMESLVVFGIIQEAGFLVWLYSLIGVTLYTWTKALLHICILSGFGLIQVKDNLVKNKILASHVQGLILFPVSILVPFLGLYNAKMILILAFVVIGLLMIWRLLRLFEDVSLDLLSFVNIILYLCAVEIAPFACILKVLDVI